MRVAVTQLCAFGARRGDLDLRFTPAATALQGQEAHRLIAARRREAASLHGEPGPQSEGGLSGAWVGMAGGRLTCLQVHGRFDGHDPRRRRLEEVKTHRGPIESVKANHRALAWAQVSVYGHLLLEREAMQAAEQPHPACAVAAAGPAPAGGDAGEASLELGLVYVHAASGRESIERRQVGAAALRAHFDALCAAYVDWGLAQQAHEARRNRALQALRFPFAGFRPGQRELAERSWRALKAGRPMLAQAPTGLGKTLATLFPALKAMGAGHLDRIAFVTPRTTGRALALKALTQLLRPAGATVEGGGGAPLRVLELVARDKACLRPEGRCDGDGCDLARGFHDRLPQARAAVVRRWDAGALPLGAAQVQQAAAEAHVCPYHLAQEMQRWADVVVGDYHHVFDPSAVLPWLAEEGERRLAVLVDEAHQLVERCREMHSAALSTADLQAVELALRDAVVAPQLRAVRQALEQVIGQALGPPGAGQAHALIASRHGWLPAVERAALEIGEHFAQKPEAARGAALQAWFALLRMQQLAETLGAHSLLECWRAEGGGDAQLRIRNVVPAPFVGPRLAAAQGAVLFSATLAPFEFHRELLGLAEEPPLDVPSPFHAAQLEVRMPRGLSTRWRDREATLGRLVDEIAAQFRRVPGNHLVFFSSHAYLNQALEALRRQHPQVPALAQQRGMSEAERDAFLARFTEDGALVGFAVLGGPFAEGVDLPGRRLVGALVATLGMPSVDASNEAVAERLEAMFAGRFGAGVGRRWHYLVPGIRKVVQAAGRVIRTPEDRGVVALLDDRLGRAEVRALLPAWWALPGRGQAAG